MRLEHNRDETGWRQKEKQPHLWSYRIYHHSEEQHLLHPPKQTLHHCTRYTHKGHSKLDKDNRKKVLHTGVCVQKLNKNIVIFHRDNLAQRKDGLCGSLWDWKHLSLMCFLHSYFQSSSAWNVYNCRFNVVIPFLWISVAPLWLLSGLLHFSAFCFKTRIRCDQINVLIIALQNPIFQRQGSKASGAQSMLSSTN